MQGSPSRPRGIGDGIKIFFACRPTSIHGMGCRRAQETMLVSKILYRNQQARPSSLGVMHGKRCPVYTKPQAIMCRPTYPGRHCLGVQPICHRTYKGPDHMAKAAGWVVGWYLQSLPWPGLACVYRVLPSIFPIPKSCRHPWCSTRHAGTRRPCG